MKTKSRTPLYSTAEEFANAMTHGLGAVLAFIGLLVLVADATVHGDTWRIIGVSVFGATLILMYTASTLYHAVSHPRLKSALRIVDHCAIFLLIAGTYTPFTLVNLRGPWGWTLFAIVWSCAVCGIAFKISMLRSWTSLSVVLYVLMGWVALIAIQPLMNSVAPGGLALMLVGGVTYSAGVIVYSMNRLPYNHAVWHMFVLAGSACHFFAVLHFVTP